MTSFGCKIVVDKEECQVYFEVDGVRMWSSEATVTYGATDCELTMLETGDLVLQSASHGWIWHSNTGFGSIPKSIYALELMGRQLRARIVRVTDDDNEVVLQEIWSTSFVTS